MNWISTTIKRKWLDKILSGEKKSELKVCNEYWSKRIKPLIKIQAANNWGPLPIGINFLCGNPNHPTKPGICAKYQVEKITIWHSTTPEDIDGVMTKEWYEIHLGDRIQ